MVTLSIDEIEKIIHSCGLGSRKAKAIWDLSQRLIEHYQSIVPCSFADLESLPGVGHKTASVIMSQIFHHPAFPVDTHIHRCSKRWKLSEGKNVIQTENDLKLLFPESSWSKLHLQMIYFGREHCPALGHKIQNCPICSWIPENLEK